jgi:DHA1 family bicyclomycin/chloramphenicol resistance-like MFS transporter
MSAPEAAPPALKNPFLVIFTLGALSTISPFAIDMYLPAFGQIAADFHTSSAAVGLSLSTYFAGMALGPLIYGPLLDRYGRKPPLYAGLALFVLTSVGCVFAPNIDVLIWLRLFQALGGCAASVAAMSLVRDLFPPKDTAKIISLIILTIGVSPLLAPTLGGLVTTWLDWHWVFAFLAAIVGLILILVLTVLPDGKPADPTVSLKPLPILTTFLGLYRNPAFVTYLFAGGFSFGSLFIYVSASPVIFMEIFHIKPEIYGLIFAGLSVGFIGSSQLNVFVNRRYSSKQILRVALSVQCVFVLAFLLAAANGWLNVWGTVALLFLILSCLGFIGPNSSATAIGSLTRDIGSGSALMSFTQIGLATLVSAVVSALQAQTLTPIVAVMTVSVLIGRVVLFVGERLGRPAHD